MPANLEALMQMVGDAEGPGPNAINLGTQDGQIVGSSQTAVPVFGRELTDMTVGEVMAGLDEGKIFAAGRPQITRDTMKDVIAGGALDANEKYGEEAQARAQQWLLTAKPGRDNLNAYMAGESNDVDAAMLDLAKEFASFPDPRTGESYYSESGNKARYSVDEVRTVLTGGAPADSQLRQFLSQPELSTPQGADQAFQTFKSTGMVMALPDPYEYAEALMGGDLSQRVILADPRRGVMAPPSDIYTLEDNPNLQAGAARFGQRMGDMPWYNYSAPADLPEVFTRKAKGALYGINRDLNMLSAAGIKLFDDSPYAGKDEIRRAAEAGQSASNLNQGIQTFEQFLQEPTAEGFATQLFGAAGEVTPTAIATVASMLATGGGGAALAVARTGLTEAGTAAVTKTTVSNILGKMARGEALDEVESLALNGVYQRYRSNALQGFKSGQWVGPAATEYAQMTGQAFGEFQDAGVALTPDRAFQSFLLGIPQTAIGVGGEAAVFDTILDAAKRQGAKTGTRSVVGEYLSRVGGATAKGAVAEGASEFLQEFVSVQQRFAVDEDFTPEEANLRLGQAAFMGAIGGGAFAGGGSSVTSLAPAVQGVANRAGLGTPEERQAAAAKTKETMSNVFTAAQDMAKKGTAGAKDLSKDGAGATVEKIFGGMAKEFEKQKAVLRAKAEGGVERVVDPQQTDTLPEPESESKIDIVAQLDAAFDRETNKNAVWIPESYDSNLAKAVESPNEIVSFMHRKKEAFAAYIPGRGTIMSPNSDVVLDVLNNQASEPSLQKALGYSHMKSRDNGTHVVRVVNAKTGEVIHEQLTTVEDMKAAFQSALHVRGRKVNEYLVDVVPTKQALDERKARAADPKNNDVKNMAQELDDGDYASLEDQDNKLWDEQYAKRAYQRDYKTTDKANPEQLDATLGEVADALRDPKRGMEAAYNRFFKPLEAFRGEMSNSMAKAILRMVKEGTYYPHVEKNQGGFLELWGVPRDETVATPGKEAEVKALRESLLAAARNDLNPKEGTKITDFRVLDSATGREYKASLFQIITIAKRLNMATEEAVIGDGMTPEQATLSGLYRAAKELALEGLQLGVMRKVRGEEGTISQQASVKTEFSPLTLTRRDVGLFKDTNIAQVIVGRRSDGSTYTYGWLVKNVSMPKTADMKLDDAQLEMMRERESWSVQKTLREHEAYLNRELRNDIEQMQNEGMSPDDIDKFREEMKEHHETELAELARLEFADAQQRIMSRRKGSGNVDPSSFEDRTTDTTDTSDATAQAQELAFRTDSKYAGERMDRSIPQPTETKLIRSRTVDQRRDIPATPPPIEGYRRAYALTDVNGKPLSKGFTTDLNAAKDLLQKIEERKRDEYGRRLRKAGIIVYGDVRGNKVPTFDDIRPFFEKPTVQHTAKRDRLHWKGQELELRTRNANAALFQFEAQKETTRLALSELQEAVNQNKPLSEIAKLRAKFQEEARLMERNAQQVESLQYEYADAAPDVLFEEGDPPANWSKQSDFRRPDRIAAGTASRLIAEAHDSMRLTLEPYEVANWNKSSTPEYSKDGATEVRIWSDVPDPVSRVLGIARKQFRLHENVHIFTYSHLAADFNKYFGSFDRMSETGQKVLDQLIEMETGNVQGSFIPGDKNIVILNDHLIDEVGERRDYAMAMVLAHEIGEVVFEQEKADLFSPEKRDLLRELQAEYKTAMREKDVKQYTNDWAGFSEWYADQIAAYIGELSSTHKVNIRDGSKPSKSTEDHFRAIAQRFKQFLRVISRMFRDRFDMNKEFRKYVETVVKNRAANPYLRRMPRSVESRIAKNMAEDLKKAKGIMNVTIKAKNGATKTLSSANGGLRKWLSRHVMASDDYLRKHFGEPGVELAKMFYNKSQSGESTGFHTSHVLTSGRLKNILYFDVLKMTPKEAQNGNFSKEVYQAFYEAEDDTKKTADLSPMAKRLRKFMELIYDDYIKKTPEEISGEVKAVEAAPDEEGTDQEQTEPEPEVVAEPVNVEDNSKLKQVVATTEKAKQDADSLVQALTKAVEAYPELIQNDLRTLVRYDKKDPKQRTDTAPKEVAEASRRIQSFIQNQQGSQGTTEVTFENYADLGEYVTDPDMNYEYTDIASDIAESMRVRKAYTDAIANHIKAWMPHLDGKLDPQWLLDILTHENLGKEDRAKHPEIVERFKKSSEAFNALEKNAEYSGQFAVNARIDELMNAEFERDLTPDEQAQLDLLQEDTSEYHFLADAVFETLNDVGEAAAYEASRLIDIYGSMNIYSQLGKIRDMVGDGIPKETSGITEEQVRADVDKMRQTYAKVKQATAKYKEAVALQEKLRRDLTEQAERAAKKEAEAKAKAKAAAKKPKKAAAKKPKGVDPTKTTPNEADLIKTTRWIPVRKRANFMHRRLNRALMEERFEQASAMISRELKVPSDEADAILMEILHPSVPIPEDTSRYEIEFERDGVKHVIDMADKKPGMSNTRKRTLPIDTVKLRDDTEGAGTPMGWLVDPIQATLDYIHDVTKAVEFEKRGGMDRVVDLIRQMPIEDRWNAIQAVHANLGMLGHERLTLFGKDVTDAARTANSVAMTHTVLTTLTFAVLSSFPDVAAVAMRSKEASLLGQVFRQLRNTMGEQENAALARATGLVTAETIANEFMSEAEVEVVGKPYRKIMDKFFKYTGTEWYTRFMRTFAAGMGREFLLHTANHPEFGERQQRHLDELGVTREEILAWDERGRPLFGKENRKVLDAISRFAEESILRPNASQRPTWASNPWFQVIWQLKSYFYAYGKTVMGGFYREIQATMKEEGGPQRAALMLLMATGLIAALTMLGLEAREYAKWWIRYLNPFQDADESVFRSDYMEPNEYALEILDRSGTLGPATMLLSTYEGVTREGIGNLAISNVPILDAVDDSFIDGDWKRLVPVFNNV
jgi:hypothetical protein